MSQGEAGGGELGTRKLIRVVIAEDQAMVLGALAALLEMEGDIKVIAQVRNGRQAYEAVRVNCPDVLITDIEMPEMTGLELVAQLKGRSATRVIVVTTFARPGYLRRAIDAGALGYLLKDSPARELADAVRRVYSGQRVINSELAAEALSEPDPLTDRERQVLRLAGDGASSEEDCQTARSFRWHGEKLPVRSDRQAGCGESGGCLAYRAREGWL